MLISCKCLNFIATSNNQQIQARQSQTASQQQQLPATTADLKEKSVTEAAVAMQQLSDNCNNPVAATSSNSAISTGNKSNDGNESFSLTSVLRKSFLKKYPRSFIFYSQCVDFFKQAIGPVPDLTINVLSQRDLIYSLTLDVSESETTSENRSSWQMSICSNCNMVLCAKRLNGNAPQFLINCILLTNNEELSQKRSNKSFSDTFGLLIMDHPEVEVAPSNQTLNTTNNLTIDSLSTSFAMSSAMNQHLDSKQLRLRQLQANLQQRLQREIAETDERIQRYTSQQFALLKSFREKSEQEYQMLVSLIQCVPEQQANEWLERLPPALDVSNSGVNLSYGGARRRNTVSNRRELNNTTTPTTPTVLQPPNNIFNANKESNVSAIMLTAANNTQSENEGAQSAGIVSNTATIAGNSSALNRKLSNFDTPPATPEATPMSVGNSPTFRQQQQQQLAPFGNQQQIFQQQYPTPTLESTDDCLFELEGVENINVVTTQQQQQMILQNPSTSLRLLQTQQQQLQTQNVPHQILPPYNSYQRNISYINAQQENQISDLDESDDAEEAEDALDLDTSMPIATPQRRIQSKNAAQVGNFAKSLPIDISNSPLTIGRGYMATVDSEDELDNNVDIAASIKALAKSVHGEAVFGDLPRPRLRSQI